MRRLAVIALMLVAGSTAAHASTAADPLCGASQLKGSLTELRYSREKTTLHYTLVLTNTGPQCGVMGAPTGVLLSKARKVLSTHVVKPSGSELYVVVRPGQAVRSSLLLSRVGGCGAVAYWLRLRGPNGHGSIDVPLKPPARACRYGRLDFTFFGPGG